VSISALPTQGSEFSTAGADPAIDRPIFIIGTGRSGTTLLHRLMACHPDLGWFSNITTKFPRLPFLAGWSRLLDVPGVSGMLNPDWRLTPKEAESYPLLNRITDRKFTVQHTIGAEDVTEQASRRFRQYVRTHLRWQGKPRFVHKHTGFPRTSYLSKIFPDALFVHVLRDGRAVANSLARVPWWDGTMKSWWWGPMDPVDEEHFKRSGSEPIVLAGLVWKTLVAHLQAGLAEVDPARCFEVRYDHLVENPSEMLEQLCQFCALENPDQFRNRVGKIRIHNADTKWKKQLDPRKIALLESCLEEPLQRLKFS
jgi:hypothetical protein